MTRNLTQWICSIVCFLVFTPAFAAGPPKPSTANDASSELKFVVYLSRHGVRSPTGTAAQYNVYSRAPWPAWDVPPGYLTAHGYQLMKLFGVYDRLELEHQGLLTGAGCDDAGRITFYADSDQRTRETGKALAEGLLPECNAVVRSLPEGTNDPLFHFHPAEAQLGGTTPSQLAAAIAARVGNPTHLTDTYRPQLQTLDTILATCGPPASAQPKRVSLFDIPATLSPGSDSHLAELRGPLNTASTLVENLLLEYTEGMDASTVGWGCVDAAKLRSLMDLHTAATDFTERTPAIARIAASNLLARIVASIEQAVAQRPIPGAVGKPADRALFLIGHDTNITNLAGLLNLNWVADGRRDDTPPGGALVFELWQSRKTGEFSVRTYFSVQTLEQMRAATPLTLSNPPQRVPVILTGCPAEKLSCPWPAFKQIIARSIDSSFVTVQ